MSTVPQPVKIVVTALGGQGGGVLTNWIVRLAERQGWTAQSTSVPGVAQRTGATIYYLELLPDLTDADAPPVLALMPAPCDVDILIAAEMMEVGRAMTRGLVSAQTLVIASTHRAYAISEKMALGDGRMSDTTVREAVIEKSTRAVLADMQAAAHRAGCPISAVLFGALAGTGALPFGRSEFEAVIEASGRGAASNLAGFALGADLAARPPAAAQPMGPTGASEDTKSSRPPRAAARRLRARVETAFAPAALPLIREGVRRLVDYQGYGYAHAYLDRLTKLSDSDPAAELTKAVAKHLAVWMSFEDIFRVADLKTRRERFARSLNDIQAAPGQIVHLSEFMHPRYEEICDALPAPLGRSLMRSRLMRRLSAPLFRSGRRVRTTGFFGFQLLYGLAALRFMRPMSLRYSTETARMEAWLAEIVRCSADNYAFACEVARLAELIKGYGDTHARGWQSFSTIMGQLDRIALHAEPPALLAELRQAALRDEEGLALAAALRRLSGEEPMPDQPRGAAVV